MEKTSLWMIKSINDDLEVEETKVLHSGKKTDLSSFPKTAEKETILITLGSHAWCDGDC